MLRLRQTHPSCYLYFCYLHWLLITITDDSMPENSPLSSGNDAEPLPQGTDTDSSSGGDGDVSMSSEPDHPHAPDPGLDPPDPALHLLLWLKGNSTLEGKVKNNSTDEAFEDNLLQDAYRLSAHDLPGWTYNVPYSFI